MAHADQAQEAREHARVRDAVLSGDPEAPRPRDLIAESWQRSLAAHINPDHRYPQHVYDHREVAQVRDGHPLAEVLPVLRDTLVAIADDAVHMMIVTDAQGHILWREGHRGVLRTAEQVGLVEGTRWAEDSIGTNAMGTAIAADQAVQIHSAEHIVRNLHAWTCTGAPIHDPESGDIIGAVDLSGPLHTMHPTGIALVAAAARLAHGHLAARLEARDARLLARSLPHLAALRGETAAIVGSGGRVLAAQPLGWLPARVQLPTSGDRIALGDLGEGLLEPLAEGWLLRLHNSEVRPLPVLDLPFLGASRPVATLEGRRMSLTRRHAEVLSLLALNPDGLTADELATELYGDTGKTVTVRAEVHRLRAALPGVLRTFPYQLHARVNADFLEVKRALAEGRVRDAARGYGGPLLPYSDAPGVREERERLAATLRRAVIDSGDVDAMRVLAETADGAYDQELTERLVRALPVRDPQRAVLSVRLRSYAPSSRPAAPW